MADCATTLSQIEGHGTVAREETPLGDDALLTESEVLKALNISHQTRWRLTKAGKLPVVYIGRAARFQLGNVRAVARGQAA